MQNGNSHDAPRERLADLREWLMDRIDGSIETRGEDGLISDFIRQIDALPSEKASTVALSATVAAHKHNMGSVTEPHYVVDVEVARQLERELIDLKQRLLPQFAGRAERAEKAKRMADHERDAMLEELIALSSRMKGEQP